MIRDDFVKHVQLLNGEQYTNYVCSKHGASRLHGIQTLETARLKLRFHREKLKRDLGR